MIMTRGMNLVPCREASEDEEHLPSYWVRVRRPGNGGADDLGAASALTTCERRLPMEG